MSGLIVTSQLGEPLALVQFLNIKERTTLHRVLHDCGMSAHWGSAPELNQLCVQHSVWTPEVNTILFI